MIKFVGYALTLPVVLGLIYPAPAQSGASASTNQLTGKVIDLTTGQALYSATGTVIRQIKGKDSLLTGSQTDKQGRFIIQNLPAGAPTARVTFISYLTLSQAIRISQPQTDLDTLSLHFPLGSGTGKRNQRKIDRPDIDFSN